MLFSCIAAKNGLYSLYLFFHCEYGSDPLFVLFVATMTSNFKEML